MPTYSVFASYAQADREEHLERFIKEIRDQLRALQGMQETSTLVFFDRDGVSAGDEWEPRIVDAVRTAEVLVCLMSPTYLGREWCGRELEVFLLRHGQVRQGCEARFIFPIWWQPPAVPRPLPKSLSRFHPKDRKFPQKYDVLGVRGLARNRLWLQFGQVADRLAQLIGETLESGDRLPEHARIADIRDIANAFDEQQPFDVRILAPAQGGNRSKVSAADRTLAAAIEITARRLHVYIRPLDAGQGIERAVRRAETERQVIVVVADAAAPADALSSQVNALGGVTLALLLVDTGMPAVGGDAWIARFPPGLFAEARARGMMRVGSADTLAAELERLVDEARRRAMAGRAATRAEDPQLEAQARDDGIVVGVQPQLTGPGGEKPQ